jgi:hypothetical protein
VIWGFLFHYFIAAVFTIVLFLLYPAFSRILKNKYVIGIIDGLLIWAIMNLIILPLTNIPKRPMHFGIGLLEGIAALIICVGIPTAVIADRFIKRQV